MLMRGIIRGPCLGGSGSLEHAKTDRLIFGEKTTKGFEVIGSG